MWREVELSPQERAAFLIENHNIGACGSAGCTLYVFVQEWNAKFVQILSTTGDVGDLDVHPSVPDRTNLRFGKNLSEHLTDWRLLVTMPFFL
jgi:hypothetical protein